MSFVGIFKTEHFRRPGRFGEHRTDVLKPVSYGVSDVKVVGFMSSRTTVLPGWPKRFP